MSIFNLKTNPTHRFVLHIWQSISADFTQGIFWVPVVVTVVGVPWTLISFVICVIVAMVCISALLVVRRRRALVLSSLKKGLLTFKNNNNSKDEVVVAPASAAVPSSSFKNTKKTNYNHNMKKNQNSVIAVTYPQGISNENDVRLCDLTQHGAEKLWPEGSARVFEGSELFYQGLTSQQLWDFCFGASKQQVQKNKQKSSSSSSFGLPLLIEESYDFVVENFASILESGGNITGCFLDFCHNWTATSLLCLLLLGDKNDNNNITSSGDISLFSRYFQTNTHFILGLFISALMLLLGSSKIIDARKVRMWFVLIIFGGYFILGISAKIDESVKFVAASASQFFSFFSSSSSASSTTPTTTFATASRTEQMLFDSFFSKISINETDDLENIHASLMMGKKSVVTNPASLLLHNQNEFVPFSRQLAVFLLCAFTRFFVNNTTHPSVTTPGADELDQFVDPTSFSDFLSSQQQENVLERAKSISQGCEITTTTTTSKPIPAVYPSSTTLAVVTTAVLTKDSVAVTSTFHFEYIIRKAAWSFIFACTAAWALPAMCWDAVFPTYVGAVAFKNPEIFGATFLQRIVVLAALFFVPFHFLTISLPKRLNSVFFNDPASVWTRYPRVGRGTFVAFGILLFVGALSSSEIKRLRPTAARQSAKTTADDNVNDAAPENEIIIAVGTLEMIYNFIVKNVFLGLPPWWIVMRLDFFFSGVATITVPMLMFTKTEETLHNLGFPSQMVSLRAASLLDNGRARIIGLIWMALWSYFVFVRLGSM